MRPILSVILGGAAIAIVMLVRATPTHAGDEPKSFFIGNEACKPCHYAKNTGGQWKVWKESPHSKAWETLGTERAKTIGKAKGIDDPQKASACLRCHVAALGEPKERLGPKFTIEDGVQCENCHGAGSEYYPREIMLDHALATSKGMIIGNEKLCRTCHNDESPTAKEFRFEESWKRIAHPVPEERKTANAEAKGKPEKHD